MSQSEEAWALALAELDAMDNDAFQAFMAELEQDIFQKIDTMTHGDVARCLEQEAHLILKQLYEDRLDRLQARIREMDVALDEFIRQKEDKEEPMKGNKGQEA